MSEFNNPISAYVLTMGFVMFMIAILSHLGWERYTPTTAQEPAWMAGLNRLGILFMTGAFLFPVWSWIIGLLGYWKPTAIIAMVLSPLVLFGPALCAIGGWYAVSRNFWNPLWRWLAGENISDGDSYQRFIHH